MYFNIDNIAVIQIDGKYCAFHNAGGYFNFNLPLTVLFAGTMTMWAFFSNFFSSSSAMRTCCHLLE